MKTGRHPFWITLLALSCAFSTSAMAKDAKLQTSVQLSSSTRISPVEPYVEEIQMFAGETRVIATPNIGRAVVGNGEFLSASVVDNKDLLLIAHEVGITSLHLWTRNGQTKRVRVTVVPAETPKVEREIVRFLEKIPNTKVSTIGEHIIVEGELLSNQDMEKIKVIAKKYPQILDFTNKVGWEQMVIMEVRVVEFPVSELREMGLKWNAVGGGGVGAVWSPLYRGPENEMQLVTQGLKAPPIRWQGSETGVLTSGLSALTGFNLGLDAQLKMLASNGDATILAEPTLSARNGSKATFLAGGQVPYAVSTSNGPAVTYKDYGVKLEIQPEVDSSGVIKAYILSEVSNLDSTLSGLGAPAINTRRTMTEFNVREGETIVISGLLTRDVTNTVEKVPFLGDVPILGEVFRSRRFQNKETELVVFVTPHLMDSRAPELAEKVNRADERINALPRANMPDTLPRPSLDDEALDDSREY